MPRRAFIADLQDAVDNFRAANVLHLRAGEEDGLINFDYVSTDGSTSKIAVLVTDLGDYPDSHMYMIYTESDHVPPSIQNALHDIGSHDGIKVLKMLASVSRHLDTAALPKKGSQANPVNLDDSQDPMAVEVDSESDPEDFDNDDDGIGAIDDDDDDDAWSTKSPKTSLNEGASSSTRVAYPLKVSATRERIRSDLSLAKHAGFRLSLQGSLLNGGRTGFLTLSIRVSKLGISDEALRAWNMDPEQYFILFIRYMNGYQTLESITGGVLANTKDLVTFRTGLYERYRVEVGDLSAVFAVKETKTFNDAETSDLVPRIGRLFIGRPLEELMNERLFSLLNYRMAMGFPWLGAEQFLNDHQGRDLSSDVPDVKYWADDQSAKASALPSIVTTDHLASSEKKKSLPLLAMQFALRHLVRCTEFCLVCHCKIETDFEALKPYVCSKPLCLYQYMSLGFGPSIEHEIISQPLVVDLLISFCYASAHAQQLQSLPTGMALMVPTPSETMLFTSATHNPPAGFPPGTRPQAPPVPIADPVHGTIYTARFEPLSRDLLLKGNERPPLKVGSWIVFKPSSSLDERYHARVDEVLFPTVRLAKPIPEPRNKVNTLFGHYTTQQPIPPSNSSTYGLAGLTPAATPPPYAYTTSSTPFQDIHFVIYDENFDELADLNKYRVICSLLDTLPSVYTMRDYLLSKGGAASFLRTWSERFSQASLGLLRWIIASNRSCIVQVDNLEDLSRKSEERVSGMPGWMQFRLAQGAPDKEQRFIQSIRNTPLESNFPTIFAWHGSALANWHSIIREGLHFQKTTNGRAYGHGVYHALNVSTSLSYSGAYAAPVFQGHGPTNYSEPTGYVVPGRWPPSRLKISQALTLNEIVNAPSQFISKTPHLVVDKLDWIQSRYLFVMCNSLEHRIEDTVPTQVLDQDETYAPVGVKGKLVIPVNAISKSRRPDKQTHSGPTTKGDKKRKVDEPQGEAYVALSDDTEEEDREILLLSDENLEKVASNPTKRTTAISKGKEKASSSASATTPLTDFTPGSHNYTTLPILNPPSYATSSATRTLQRELTATLKILDTQPPHELGWYIDRELVTNMFQWIIELHSFEPHLPLSKDLRDKSLKSVLIEVRFGKDYPMSPPFVRIIRPRFLSFMAGGGGHVTAGGALCMELLTNSGWSAVSSIESVLLQVRLALSSTDPKPARLEAGAVRDYGTREAVEAYLRACRQHGWQIPPDFQSSYSETIAPPTMF